jgi:uncharacterized protein YegP (UPF0339 family)
MRRSMASKFVIKEGSGGTFRFNLKAGQSGHLGYSETSSSMVAMENGAEFVKLMLLMVLTNASLSPTFQ